MNNISRHKILCKKGEKATFSCDKCNKQFIYKSKLDCHKKIHIRFITVFRCMNCKKRFKMEDLEKQHERSGYDFQGRLSFIKQYATMVCIEQIIPTEFNANQDHQDGQLPSKVEINQNES